MFLLPLLLLYGIYDQRHYRRYGRYRCRRTYLLPAAAAAATTTISLHYVGTMYYLAEYRLGATRLFEDFLFY